MPADDEEEVETETSKIHKSGRKKKKDKKGEDAVGKFYKTIASARRAHVDHNKQLKEHKKKKHKKAILTEAEKLAKKKEKARGGGRGSDEGKVHTPSQSSIISEDILGIDILEHSTSIWLEKSKANIGIFRTVPFEYNVFDDSGERLLFIMPSIGSRENIHGTGERPTFFSVHTYMGRDVCDIKLKMDACCKKEMTAEVRVDDEPYGTVIQDVGSNDYKVFDAEEKMAMEMKIISVSGGGLCGQPKMFEWHLYTPRDKNNHVGVISRNGRRNAVLGEPLGFYFQMKHERVHINIWHKLLVVAFLLGITARCKFHFGYRAYLFILLLIMVALGSIN